MVYNNLLGTLLSQDVFEIRNKPVTCAIDWFVTGAQWRWSRLDAAGSLLWLLTSGADCVTIQRLVAEVSFGSQRH